jgi:hypothetical protein
MKTNRKKLRLDVDELRVEAFATAAGAAKHGTVHGHGDTISCYMSWCEPSCNECTGGGNSCSGPYACLCPVSANGDC